PWGGPPDTRSLSSDAAGALFANVHVGGIVRSLDGGESWRPTLPIDADVHQVLAHPERPGMVLAPAAVGLALSLDGGDSWSYETEGLHATYCRAVAASGDVVLVTASTGPRGGQAAVYRRSLDDDAGFQRCRDGLPEWFSSNINTGCLAASGALAAFGTAEGTIFASRDGGETWKLLAQDLPPVRAVTLA
ncbi:MAG: WD40/YVTN/BNR-like repeat-containing protein, partial [Actinomycetota bacterium]